jgi:hypothetical protein
MDNNFSKHEELVEQYILQGRIEDAVELLFDLILKHARKKDFSKAEVLRERLFEIDPMSLTEIIKSGEIIEEQKSESIDQDHLDVWSHMYDTLTTEEAHTLYLSLKNGTYDTDEFIFRQGELNPSLYFINHGRLKMSYTLGDREILLKTLDPGTVAGDDTFFSITVCTTSLTTLSPVKVSFLEKELFEKWQNDFPSLASKLKDYCHKLERVRDLIKKEGMDRRIHERIRTSGPLIFQILSPGGKAIGKAYKGDISDISAGGLSFKIKISKKNALLLLARNLNLKFALPGSFSRTEAKRNGTIIGITDNLSDGYTIHVKFDELLSELEGNISSESQGEPEIWLKTTI